MTEKQKDVPTVEDKNGFPTQLIDLPSKGMFYSPDNPLSAGTIDLHYMTAKHEDILTSKNLIQKGVVIDRLIQALIATPNVDYNSLLLGDKDAITIAARIFGYGKDYRVKVQCPDCGEIVETTINLEELNYKNSPLLESGEVGVNEFEYILPVSKNRITFKLLTVADENMIDLELERMQKITKSDVASHVTTRMKYSILSFNGNRETATIRKEVDNMLSIDSYNFREYMKTVIPDVDMNFEFKCPLCGHSGLMEVPLNINFFWPSSGI